MNDMQGEEYYALGLRNLNDSNENTHNKNGTSKSIKSIGKIQ